MGNIKALIIEKLLISIKISIKMNLPLRLRKQKGMEYMWKIKITTQKGSFMLYGYKTKKEAFGVAEDFMKASKETITAEVVK